MKVLVLLLILLQFSVYAEESSITRENQNIEEKPIKLEATGPQEIQEVQLQLLNKVSGKVERKRAKIGLHINFGRLRVIIKKAFKSPPEESQEIMAYIEIWEIRPGEEMADHPIYANWMFASAPVVNVFEHPIYDIRVELPKSNHTPPSKIAISTAVNSDLED